MGYRWMSGAAFSGASVVALGAFGAHALKRLVSPALLEVWQTAVLYQMVHSVVLLLVGSLLLSRFCRRLQLSAVLFSVGIVLFSGSLYLRVLLDMPSFGMVTPLGGVAFILAWLLLAFALWGRAAQRDSLS